MVTRDIFLEEMKELGCELTEAPHFDTAVGSTNLNYEPLYKHLWVPVRAISMNFIIYRICFIVFLLFSPVDEYCLTRCSCDRV